MGSEAKLRTKEVEAVGASREGETHGFKEVLYNGLLTKGRKFFMVEM